MKVRHALLAAPLATAAPGADVAAETPAPCEASVSLDPSRAVPGQQVAYRLHLLVRSDVSEVAWELPPAFPGLRAERLAAEPFSRQVERGGAIYQIREEARALFAERPGRVTLPSARLACRTRGDLSASIATPEAVLEVIPFPEAELPPGFEGLVGPLSLRPSVTPRSVTLGQSVRVAVTLQGDGNLWDAPAPELSSEALGGAEVFPRPSELVLDRGSRLVVRRRFAIDVVPRREGVLRIPSLAWSYFDPASGRHAEAVAEPVMVVVGPRASARSESDAAAPEPAAPAPEPAVPSERRSFQSWVAGGLLLLAGVGATGWRLLRRRLGVARAVAEAVARAESARAAGDRDGELSALACALRAAVRSELGAALEGRPEEMPASGLSPRARAAVELLLQIEQARFDPKATPPDRAAVRRALARR